MKPYKNPFLLGGFTAALTLTLLTGADAATFTWARGVAAGGSGAFSWNNSTLNGDVTNGNNWNAASNAFPNAAEDIANIANAAGTNNQTINLNQNITIGAISNIGSTNGSGSKTIAAGGAFTLTFDNGANNSSISKLSTTPGSGATISAPIAIAGNGTLTLSNTSNAGLAISGTITSGLSSGTQILSHTGGNVTISGAIGDGSLGGQMSVQVTGGSLSLNGASTYTGATTINNGGTLTLGGTSGALSASSSITNNGTLTFARGNAVTQGTDFSSSSIGGNGVVNATATGLVLTLNTANNYAGATTIGSSANNSVVRASASGALGSGNIVLDQTGNASTARLELEGGITLNNAILFTARNNASTGIRNVSGNNILTGDLTLGTGGDTYTLESAAGHLTVGGNFVPPNSSSRTVVITGAGDGEVSGNLTFVSGNTLNLTKSGAGTWTVSSSGHTYTGTTTVSAGTLVVNGNISTSLNTNVTGGTLKGSGVVGNLNATSGTIAPGTSIESLGAGNVSIGTAATFAYELDSDVLNGDLLHASGSLSIAAGATLTLAELASGTLNIGDKLTLISYAGAWNNGLFEYLGGTLADDSVITLGSNQWLFNYNDTSGGLNFSADQSGANGFVTMTVVPEPAAALLGSLGLLGLLRRRR